ncbi:helix-turn-helix transcriptional regulator [Serinibacter arcticus]|uniref:Putative DNA-binding protein n=1 Tax=Serinibacter arcticus TaxID=1655435 RepID=A0A4Z1E2F2_9MICO|nr:helix-turn-helix transcriptional regulator [Serinibacter arcticus]TGO05419.1 putative DNA-binding protein [Serinibacter arcticus]
MAADNRSEVRDFLATRRARITPEQAGLTLYGGNRRVAGLRREEVAMLAGVSNDYYVRMERGNLAGVSEQVLDAVAVALQLDDAERGHLRDLARTATGRPMRRRRPRAVAVPASVQLVLDAMTGAPAIVRDDRFDVLAANALGRALYAPAYEAGDGRVNNARFTFLDPAARKFWADWERIADDTVGVLRSLAGRNPYDAALTALVGELATRSVEFRTRWAHHDVHLHTGGTKRINHPEVGLLELSYDTITVAQAPDLTMAVYTAAPGTATAEKLRMLASLVATAESSSEASTTTNAPSEG